ncbi:P-loop containing nucleoside triphosphate hydrolase protein [Dimargaris cristalligena]|uniref:ATP-dependent RNA helicase n=1 Tax=Dimargaris cristalligena TaxID=215637 RepID=A0A4P9ZTD3_9FUNG|nr:P-loop containing nucleoside triphosphate hydrolase protein [Dimargaris cristalligena]|eukprot:RKP36002.1 P-loop containing nucleoside triphosphate hydrolase protein [Dimargaris cristalligena]
MSKVQREVLSRLPITQDLLVKAKTGEGKTLAFLLPAIETILAQSEQIDLARGVHVGALIISPTRELANQIAEEAEKLASRHRMGVMTMVGGTERRQTMRRLTTGHRSDIIVGTPGRVIDLLQSSHEFLSRAKKTKLLILDEADELLNMGFRDDIRTIADSLPQTRRTYLFSATLSPAIQSIARDVLQPNHQYVDTVDPNDVAVHKRVKQQYAEIPSELQFRATYEILTRQLAKDRRGRIMVFLPTTNLTQLYTEALARLGLPVIGLHSKLTQNSRSRISARFRNSPGSILVTTDVSARGVDYPDVGLVLQLGTPQGRDEYIHRVGRTGRAGKNGEGIIVLSPVEMAFLRPLSDLNMLPAKEYGPEFVETITNTQSSVIDQQWTKRLGYEEKGLLHDAFMSCFGFYSSRRDLLKCSGEDILHSVKNLFYGFGFDDQPIMTENQLAKYGLNKPARGQGRNGGGRGFGMSGGRRSGGGGFGNYQGGRGFGGNRSNDRWGQDQGRGGRDNDSGSGAYGRSQRGYGNQDQSGSRGGRDNFSSRSGRNSGGQGREDMFDRYFN